MSCSTSSSPKENYLKFTSRSDCQIVNPAFGVSKVIAIIPRLNSHQQLTHIDAKLSESLHQLSVKLFELIALPNDKVTKRALQRLEKKSFKLFSESEAPVRICEPLQREAALLNALRPILRAIFPSLDVNKVGAGEVLRYFAYFRQQFYFSPWNVYWHVMSFSLSHQRPDLAELEQLLPRSQKTSTDEFGDRLQHIVLACGHSLYLVQDALTRDKGVFSWVDDKDHRRLCSELSMIVHQRQLVYAMPLTYRFWLVDRDLVLTEFDLSTDTKQTITRLLATLYLLLLEQPKSFMGQYRQVANTVFLLAAENKCLDAQNYDFLKAILISVRERVHPDILFLFDTDNEHDDVQGCIVDLGSLGVLGSGVATADATAGGYSQVRPELRFAAGPNSKPISSVLGDDSVAAIIPIRSEFEYLGRFDEPFESKLQSLANRFFATLDPDIPSPGARLVHLEALSLELFKKHAAFRVAYTGDPIIHSTERLKDALTVMFPQLGPKALEFYLPSFNYHSGTFYLSLISIFRAIAPQSAVALKPLDSTINVQSPSNRAKYYADHGLDKYMELVITQQGLSKEVEEDAIARTSLFDCVPVDEHRALLASLFKTVGYFGDVLVLPLTYYRLTDSTLVDAEFGLADSKEQFVRNMLVLVSSELGHADFRAKWTASANVLFRLIAENGLFKVETFAGFEFSLLECLSLVTPNVLSLFDPNDIIDTLQAFMEKRGGSVAFSTEHPDRTISLPISNSVEFVEACRTYLSLYRRQYLQQLSRNI